MAARRRSPDRNGDRAFRSPRQLLVSGVTTLLLLASTAVPVEMAAQGTPSAVQSHACAHLRDMIATPVTSPTIAQSTAGMNRAMISLAVETLVACRNEQQWQTFVELHEQTYLAATFGSSDRAIVITRLENLYASGFLPRTELIAAGEPAISGRTATVLVTTREGYLLSRHEWRFVRSNDQWLLAGSSPLPPSLDVNAVGIPITATESGLSTTRDHLVNPGAIILRIVNELAFPLPVTVFANPEQRPIGEVVAALSEGMVDPADVVGWVVAPANDELELVLTELPDGVYLIVADYDPLNRPATIREADVVWLEIRS